MTAVRGFGSRTAVSSFCKIPLVTSYENPGL